jgi:hypothetical protein
MGAADRFHEKYIEKTAGFGDAAKKILKYTAGGAALGLGSYAGGAAAKGIAEAITNRGKPQAFRNMLAEDSDLRRLHKAKPRLVQSHFNTMFRFNPEMAKDPVVSSSWVRGTANMGTVMPGSIKELISSRKDFHQTRQAPQFPGGKAMEALVGG